MVLANSCGRRPSSAPHAFGPVEVVPEGRPGEFRPRTKVIEHTFVLRDIERSQAQERGACGLEEANDIGDDRVRAASDPRKRRSYAPAEPAENLTSCSWIAPIRSALSNGFSNRTFGVTRKNCSARAVTVPPLMKTTLGA